MKPEEIQEVSDAFADAWQEYFGAEMNFTPLLKTSEDALYDESYYTLDLASSKTFYGRLGDGESLDENADSGGKNKTDLTIVYVTDKLKELNESNMHNSIISFVDQFNKPRYFKITDMFRRVMFNNVRIFTKLKAVEVTNIKDMVNT